jgi:hypothetical protein
MTPRIGEVRIEVLVKILMIQYAYQKVLLSVQ